MRKGTALATISGFSGGENYLFPSLTMPPKFSARMMNCHVSPRGGVAKIPGYVKVNAVAVAETLSSGCEFRTSSGTIKLLVAGQGSIYTLGGDNELDSIKTGLDATVPIWFAQFADLAIIMNGVDVPMKYDGANVAALGGQKENTLLKKPHVHKGRVWAIDATDKMSAFHSALNDPEDWTTAENAGYIDFRFVLPAGDELVEIKSFVDLLVFIFCNHIAVYSGTNPTSGGDFQLVQLISGTGAVANGTGYGLGMDLFYLERTGLRSLKQSFTVGNLNLGSISKAITPLIQTEINANVGNIYGVAQYRKNSWLMMLINSIVFIYSYEWKAWAHMSTPIAAEGEEDRGIYGMFETANGDLYLCGKGYLYRYGEGYSFAGTPMSMWWETGWTNLSRSPLQDYPRLAEVLCYPGKIMGLQFDFSVDFSAPMMENSNLITTEAAPYILDDVIADVWDNVLYMDLNEYPIIRLPLFGAGKIGKFVISNTSIDGPLEFNQIIVQGRKGGTL
jgi:hypothetical protein